MALQSLVGAWAHHATGHPAPDLAALCAPDHAGVGAPPPAGSADHPASGPDECCLSAACHAGGSLLGAAAWRVPRPNRMALVVEAPPAAAAFAPSGPSPAA